MGGSPAGSQVTDFVPLFITDMWGRGIRFGFEASADADNKERGFAADLRSRGSQRAFPWVRYVVAQKKRPTEIPL